MRRLLLAVVLLLAGAAGWLRARDPESLPMDAAARAGAPGRFVPLTDGVTHVQVDGPADGPRVVLVHGFSVPGYIWDSTVVALTAAGYRVARYDGFGRGWSDRPDADYSLAMLARQLGEVVDSLGWREPVHVVGLSYGGAVTATWIASAPQRVRSWTLVDPVAVPGGAPPAYFSLPVVGPLLWQGLAMQGRAEGQLDDFADPARWPGWPDRYRPQMRHRGFGRALLRTQATNADVVPESLYARAGRTGVPTLLVWGTEDRTVPFAEAVRVRRAIPTVEWLPIEGAGHLPHMEAAPRVHAPLTDFLRRADARAGASADAAP